MMNAYFSRTGTKRNLSELQARGWRMLLTPSEKRSPEGFRYAIDNGAWSAHLQEKPWSAARFSNLVERHGDGADFIIAPDIVAGGLDSLRLSLSWFPDLEPYGKLLIPVQDGIAPSNVRAFLDERVGIFVGGTTEWKLGTLPVWGRLARELNCYLHVGRVNTCRRIWLCQDNGADSFDGTSASMYADSLPRLDKARRQGSIFDAHL